MRDPNEEKKAKPNSKVAGWKMKFQGKLKSIKSIFNSGQDKEGSNSDFLELEDPFLGSEETGGEIQFRVPIDSGTWKATRPAKTAKDTGMAGAIKLYQECCPSNRTKLADPGKLELAYKAIESLLAAISIAENKLNEDRSGNTKVARTKSLLEDWKSQVLEYKEGLVLWVKDYSKKEGRLMKEQIEQKRYDEDLVKAQREFELTVEEAFRNCEKTMPLAKEAFDNALKEGKIEEAQYKLDLYRKRIMEGTQASNPRWLVKTATNIATRFKVEPMEIKTPQDLGKWVKNFVELCKDGAVLQDMYKRWLNAAEEFAKEDVKPVGNTDKEYQNVVKEVLKAYKKIARQAKDLAGASTEMLLRAAKIAESGLPTNENEANMMVKLCCELNQELFEMSQEMVDILAPCRQRGVGLNQKLDEVGLQEVDRKNVLGPQLFVAYGWNKKFLDTIHDATICMRNYLDNLVTKFPELENALAEIENMDGGKYKVDDRMHKK